MRDTSLFAYDSLFESGAIGRNQLTVLRALYTLEEACDKEIAQQLGWDRCSVTGRRNELENDGYVYSVRKEKRPGSDRVVHVWRINESRVSEVLEKLQAA